MEIFLLILFGALSGVLGGMGMGGGTLLIPLLNFLNIEQQTIQAINLLSFLPMAAVALILHSKNKLIEKSKTLWLIVPAVIFAVVGAYLTKLMSSEMLKICFGIFLLILGIWQLFLAIKFKLNKAKKD